jgi:DNA polymerase-3 subunit beta
MKFSCRQKHFQKALNIVGKSVSGNNTLPVLNNILISSDKNNEILLTSTNLELGVVCRMPANIENEGATTVPAKLITSYVGYLHDEDITIEEQSGAELLITSSSSKTKMKGMSAQEFPSIPEVSGGIELEIEKQQFLLGLDETVLCASANLARPVLNGVLMKIESGVLSLAATDSFRLAEKKIPVEYSGEDFSIIIPSRSLHEVIRIFSNDEAESMHIKISQNQLCISTPSVSITTRLIEGKFPEYGQIIPKENPVVVHFEREQVLSVLKRIGIFARENNNTLHLKVNNGTVVLSSEANQFGSEEDTLDCEGNGEGSIALNIEFLTDVFQTLKDEKVVFSMNNEISPAVITQPDDDSYVHIIMPLKI